MKLSIVIPAYNEEQRLPRMLDAYVPHFTERYGDDVEFVVVVNGSTDRTADVARTYAETHPGLRVIEEPARIGKGGAIMLGFQAAHGAHVGFVDADGSTPPAAFQDLVEQIGDAGMIIASRWLPASEVSPRQPWARRMASRMFNFLVRHLFRLRITDTQCGAKLMSREALDAVLPKLGLTRWAFDVDLLFQTRRAHFGIREIPTIWHDVAGSKIQVVRSSFEMLLAITRLRLLHSPFRWVVSVYDRIYGMIGTSDRLLRDTILLILAGQVANVANMLFQAVMGRTLSVDEYGVLATMLNSVHIVFIPLGALGAGAAHYAARFVQDGTPERVIGLVKHWAFYLLGPILAFLALVVLNADPVASFFRLDSSTPVILTGIIIALTIFLPVFSGFLQGLQAFIWMSLVGISWALFRLAAGSFFVSAFRPTAVWALSGQVCGAAACAVVGIVGLRVVLRGAPRAGPEAPGGTRTYVTRSVLPLMGLAVFMSADMILIKHFFDRETAGYSAQAFQIGRIMFFLVMPIVRALFPKVVSGGSTSTAEWLLLLRGWIYALVVVALAVAGCCLVPQLPLWVFFGRDAVTPEMMTLVRLAVCAMAPIGLLSVSVHFELAQKRFAVTPPIVVSAAGYVIGVFYRHDTVLDVLLMLGIFSTAALVACVILQLVRARRLLNGISRKKGEAN